ncbi:hypothetical protein NE237_033225 [Protea cynaroides]|uniref:Uncharacterized protein n=1 Tax=Protea cynaroides TaxID=273540 RepID=A0A9Q0L4I0_9MAGN|nr:hypothetical protein NE237_033225 [Protea cynaroides]
MVDLLLTTRYSLREEVNGRQQHNPKNSLELFNDTIATPKCTLEKKPRESILRAEFASAIEFINKDLIEENRLKFLHWDLHKNSRNNARNVLAILGRVAAYALDLTGSFYCQATPSSILDRSLKWPHFREDDAGDWSDQSHCYNNKEGVCRSAPARVRG